VNGYGPIRARALAPWSGHHRSMPKVTCLANGPFLVDGVTEVVDATGKPFELNGKTRVALCRCATSRTKPFCDGSHKAGFSVADVAPRKP